MNEEILGLLGVSPEQIQQFQQQQSLAGLGAFGTALMQAGAPQAGGRTSTLAGFGQAAPAFQQGRAQEMDNILRGLLQRRQVEQMGAEQRAKQQQAEARQRLIGGLTPQQQALATAFPESAQGIINPAATPPQVLKEGDIAFDLSGRELFRGSAKPAPGIVGSYNAALTAGLIPRDTTLQQFSKMMERSGTTVNVGGVISPFAKKAQEGQAATFIDIEKAGLSAQGNLRTIDQLGKYLERVDTGGLAALQQFAGNFGIDTKGLSDIQAATALINRLVPAQRTPGSGPMSDADLALFKQSLPRIINQPGGNQKIISTLRDINNYLIEEGKVASQVLAQKLTPEEGARKMLELGNPLAGVVDEAPMPPGVTVRRIR